MFEQISLFDTNNESYVSHQERERILEHRILEDIEFDRICSAQDELKTFIEYRNEGYFNGTVEEWFQNIGSENLLPYLQFV